MDYEQVYYVTDNRNAVTVRDHRPMGGGSGRLVPATTAVATAVPIAPAVPQPSYQYPQYPQSLWGGYPLQPPYVMPPMAAPSNLSSILGGFGNVGSLASIIAQVFAALLPLPAAPTPQDTNGDSDAASNAAVNSSNLIRYQNALALFARRDQQILTLGSVLKELLKRPGMVTG